VIQSNKAYGIRVNIAVYITANVSDVSVNEKEIKH
jgi:hypothetical protein